MQTVDSLTERYSEAFYERLLEESRGSAQEVVPLVVDIVRPGRVIDVGCGIGTWLAVFRDLGVEHIRGLDGAWVDRQRLLIPESAFEASDLESLVGVTGSFDLAISLEVAEHLSPAAGERLVQLLTQVAPTILFCAAIPDQGGVYHVNERWQSYWVERFNARNFVAIDCLRRRLWHNARVAPYYAQNVFLFVERDYLTTVPALNREYERHIFTGPLDVVHPALFLGAVNRCRKQEVEIAALEEQRNLLLSVTPGQVSLKRVLGALPRLLTHALKRRLHRPLEFRRE